MRPLTLAMTGFRSYSAPTFIDFTGKSSVAVIGDTGAGKSSILEAITYALYGRCSWNAVVQPLLADGAKALQVDLTFTHEGQRWRASRTLRKTATTTASSHRLENLDTGDRWDNAGPVNNKIRALLCMDHSAFESVVLLPQGRFGKLLEATDSIRTAMLQDLFGAQDLLAIRDLADARARAISAQLADARETRARLLPDPAAAAAEAAALSAAAEKRAGLLGDALATMTGLQQRADQAAASRAAAVAGAEELARVTVTDAAEVMTTLAPIAAEIEQKVIDAGAALEEARRHDTDIDRKIQAAVEAAAPIQDLHAAAAALSDVPGILDSIREFDASITDERTRLAEQHAAIEQDSADLEVRRGAARDADGKAQAAVATARSCRIKSDGVGDYIAAALRAADTAAQATAELQTAKEYHTACNEKLTPLQETANATQRALETANQALDELRTRAAAAAIATHLHGGDDCPVCQRTLPAGYQAPHADADAIAEAEGRHDKALTEHRRADTELVKANAAAETAQAAIDARASDLTRATEAIGATIDAAGKAYADLVTAVPVHPPTVLEDLDHFQAALQQAADAIAQDPDDDNQHALEVEPRLRAPLRAAADALTQHGQDLTTAVATTLAALKTAETGLAGRRRSHERETAELTKQVKRRNTAAKSLSAKIAAVPAYTRGLLPADPLQITADEIQAAETAVTSRLQELDRFDREKKTVQREIEQQRQAQQAALDEASARVQEPLRVLQRRLETWAQAVARIAGSSASEGLDLAALDPGTQPTTMQSVQQYTNTVTVSAAALAARLDRQAEEAEADQRQSGTDFAAAAKTLVTQTGLEINADLSAANALHPLIAAEHAARTDAQRHREEYERARGQIRQAGDLDYAIAAGTARHGALEEVRRQLANSKFLAYLISRRTEALLRTASHTLGQLSDDQFGFATDFQIVSRGSGVVHGPERLSGGEKFLASLALALALVELHARGGPRLGALFLDEGFAALDAAALDTALAVLRDQAGGDRLVMAVSHLHAVAEAVDDVLWVERHGAGSKARWMTDEERDTLAERHGDPGLL
jgi:exonuclease SbcC